MNGAGLQPTRRPLVIGSVMRELLIAAESPSLVAACGDLPSKETADEVGNATAARSGLIDEDGGTTAAG